MNMGASIMRRCNFDTALLTKPELNPRQANVFYELYLEDYNGDLIDVPVKIKNMMYDN